MRPEGILLLLVETLALAIEEIDAGNANGLMFEPVARSVRHLIEKVGGGTPVGVPPSEYILLSKARLRALQRQFLLGE
jgi:hypothetical protein